MPRSVDQPEEAPREPLPFRLPAAQIVQEESAGAAPLGAGAPGEVLRRALNALNIRIRINAVSNDIEWRGLTATTHPSVDRGAWRTAEQIDIDWLRAELESRFTIPDASGDQKPYSMGEAKWDQAVAHAASANVQHPVMDWLSEIRRLADPGKRAGETICALIGAEQTPLNVWAVESVLGGVVMRAHRPGCPLRHLTILIGGQGCGKSLFLSKLLPDHLDPHFFSGFSFGGPNKKDMVERLHGIVLAEASEMAGLTAADIEGVKAFLTTAADRIRMPYARRACTMPRTAVVAGTANDAGSGILPSDATGNTRYIPVPVAPVYAGGVSALVRVLLSDDWPAIRDSLWRDVAGRYDAGERWHSVPPECLDDHAEASTQWTASGGDEGWKTYADAAYAASAAGSERTAVDLLDQAIPGDDKELRRSLKLKLTEKSAQTQFGIALGRAGFKRRRTCRGARYVKPADAPGPVSPAVQIGRIPGM